MKSFRLKFIDVDESFSTSTVEAPIKGYMICRAPKGTTEATYFPFGNEKTINAMIGLQTANWPDLYEAIAFNTEYGLYISAPPGTSEEYPSYYGGCYITTKSIFDYWRVDDKDNPNFEIQLFPGYEKSEYDSSLTDSIITISDLNVEHGKKSTVQITNVSASLMQKINYMNLIAWDDLNTKVEDGSEVVYHIDNNTIYAVVDDADDKTTGTVGSVSLGAGGTYTIIFGGDKSNNAVTSNGVPYFDFTNLFDYTEFVSSVDNTLASDVVLVGAVSASDDDGTTSGTSLTGEALIKYLIIHGSTSKFKLQSESLNKSKDYSPFKGLEDRIYYRVNIKNETLARISQKSPNETPTSITISNIGYDKYLYDVNVRYILKEDFESKLGDGVALANYAGIKDSATSGDPTSTTGQTRENFVKDLISSNADGIIDVISTTSPESWTKPFDTHLHSLWKYDITLGTWTDVTPDYVTKSIYISGPLINSGTGVAYSDDAEWDSDGNGITDDNDGYVHGYCENSIWYIASAGRVGKYNHTSYMREAGGAYPLQPNVNFDTITLSCKEKVYPGAYMSGGEFTGSLEEQGVNSEGTNIYWPNVLPQDASSFIEVTPVNTLDELGIISDKGFFMGERLVDPIGPAQDVKTFTIQGQRTMTAAVNGNIKGGTLGCAWSTMPVVYKNSANVEVSGTTTAESVFAAAINAGIVEAQQNMYDDALVFMECSGQEAFKSKLMSLRTTFHDTCTIISPKIINKAEFTNPETITVSGRSTGTAQYIGEFKVYDTYTGKYYWCQPIGDVGVNLARIMEKKLGGIAPAGTNDSQGLGGILSRAVLDKKWDFSDDALRILDEKGLNPITYDSANGLMIQSQKTTQDPANETDWSYLGHSMSFDLCKREIRDNVMVPQLHKRISEYYYNIREKQVQNILDKRTTGTDPIWSSATVDIANVNTPSTKAQRKFMITVKIRVYPYSNYVVLTFTTLGQE